MKLIRFISCLIIFIFRNSLRILWEASCKTAKFFVSGSQVMISARGSWHDNVFGRSRDLSQRLIMTQRISSRQDSSRDMPHSLFLFLISWYFIDMRRADNLWHLLIFIFIVVFYQHGESCQFAAFIIKPEFCFSFRDGYYFIELNHGSNQPVVYDMKFWMVPLNLSSKYYFLRLAPSVFQIHSSGYMTCTFIITHSYGQLATSNLGLYGLQ